MNWDDFDPRAKELALDIDSRIMSGILTTKGLAELILAYGREERDKAEKWGALLALENLQLKKEIASYRRALEMDCTCDGGAQGDGLSSLPHKEGCVYYEKV